MFGSTAAVFFSETVLSLYPILIKAVPTNLGTQTLARFLIYPLAALLVGGLGPLVAAYKGGAAAVGRNLGIGALNVSHIAASYLAFRELPAGIAMSLFYTYPLWNLIGATVFFGEAFPWHLLPVVGIALFGTFLVATSKTGEGEGANGSKTLSMRGIIAALLSSLTETAIFLLVRGAAGQSPFFTIHQLYLGGLPILIAGLAALKNIQPVDWNLRHWAPLLAFNGLLGFTGYSLRFWSINKMPTILFSVLSLFGVLGSFFFGSVLVGEPIIPRAITGAAILTGAIGYLQYLMHS